MKHKSLSVFEHGYLSVCEGELTPAQFEQLVVYNDTHAGKYFEVKHKRLRFKQYVGVIQVGNLVIEVLPKADKNPVSEGEVTRWRKVLLEMLHRCKRIKVDSLPQASLAVDHLPLMDVYIRQFVHEVESIVHKGLIKGYRKEQCNEQKLRGRLIFAKQVSVNALHKERFYTEHTTYDSNNVHNQVLAKALKIVLTLSSSIDVKGASQKLLLSFDDIADISGKSSALDRIPKTRKTHYYESAIDLALMIIRNYSPDIRGGNTQVLALLFDMNSLFEDYVFRMMKQCESDFSSMGLIVTRQVSEEFWNKRTMRPDIVMEFNDSDVGRQRIVLDTKWKNLSNNTPSFDDVRQMYTYNIHLGAKRSVLIYPNCDNKNTGHIAFYDSIGVAEQYKDHSCQVYFIELLEDSGQLDKRAGARLMSRLLTPGNA